MCFKGNHHVSKKTVHRMEKNFTNHISVRDLYLGYINNSYRLIIQRQKKLKRSKDLTFLQ